MKLIYGLRAKSDLIIRYIGQTGYGLDKRFRDHLSSARARAQPLHDWILSSVENNNLEIVPLLSVDAKDANRAERILIRMHKRSGCLLNVRDGWRRGRDKTLIRPILIENDDNSTFLITCPSIPSVKTFSSTAELIVRHANDAIEEALAADLADLRA